MKLVTCAIGYNKISQKGSRGMSVIQLDWKSTPVYLEIKLG